mmetsp:Transcript_25439/g.72937  ORF Transcript_25439/g.72937 Transcript_25439/m.72937 type:complete len:275 (+) Transcript_25439:100-924(+)
MLPSLDSSLASIRARPLSAPGICRQHLCSHLLHQLHRDDGLGVRPVRALLEPLPERLDDRRCFIEEALRVRVVPRQDGAFRRCRQWEVEGLLSGLRPARIRGERQARGRVRGAMNAQGPLRARVHGLLRGACSKRNEDRGREPGVRRGRKAGQCRGRGPIDSSASGARGHAAGGDLRGPGAPRPKQHMPQGVHGDVHAGAAALGAEQPCMRAFGVVHGGPAKVRRDGNDITDGPALQQLARFLRCRETAGPHPLHEKHPLRFRGCHDAAGTCSI